jgi:hypothetical protein
MRWSMPPQSDCAKLAFAFWLPFNQETLMPQSHTTSDVDANEPIPWMQKLLDNPFILLFLGVMIPMIVYTLWGVIDILTVPLAK